MNTEERLEYYIAMVEAYKSIVESQNKLIKTLHDQLIKEHLG